MSEKANINTEVTQIPSEMILSKPNKLKHNSKRRKCKKNKFFAELDSGSESNVDLVVNYLCCSLMKNNFDTSLETNFLLPSAEKSQKTVGTSRTFSQDSDFDNAEQLNLPSTNGLSSLFEELQICSQENFTKSGCVTDHSNFDHIKQTKDKSFLKKNLEEQKNYSFQGESCTQNENLKEYLNLSMIQNLQGSSVLSEIDSSCMRSVSEIEQTYYSQISEVKKKSNKYDCIKEYYGVSDSMTENKLVASTKNSSILSVKESDNSFINNKSQENIKKVQKFKKKAKSKKNNEMSDKNEFFIQSEKVYLNLDLQKNHSCQPAPSDSCQTNKNKRKQDNSKSSPGNDTKFPKYLSSDELQSLSNFGVLLTGIIRINQKNYKEAYITAPDKGTDILIEGLKDRNRALEGDEVYFVLKPKEHHRVSIDSHEVQRTGVIVAIKTLNHNRGAIGTLNPIKNKSNNFALFSPRDSRLPRIKIKKNNWPKGFSENSANFINNLYFAKILHWKDLRYAEGEIVKEVGVAGNLQAETDAILLKYGLDVTSYSEGLKQYLPSEDFKILESDFQDREDFRKDCIFTIDPPTAVDLDDAVSCKHLPNGNYEVGVHISDVSYFLNEGTPLDKAIGERATTVYLVQKTYHMLPLELCRLCSLTPGEDKFSFSVLWEVTPDCKIIKHRFARSVINSCAQLSYDQVQAVIDNSSSCDSIFPKIHGNHTIENIKDIILFLHELAVGLRNKRFQSGALRIDQKKIYFSLDENKLPIDFKEDTHEPSHQLIEEFMLLANITVAEKLNSSFPDLAFLRSHPPPLQYVLEKLQKTLEKYGIILDISSSGSLQASLLNYSGNDIESHARMLVLNNSLAKPMARAKYYCGGLFSKDIDRRHYALSVPLYTHFTSPIRRYADVMVHRLLAASLNFCNLPQWKADYIQLIASNCNKQKYAAKMAQEMSTELYFALFIEFKGTMVCDAVVCDIKDKSFDCIGLSTGIHQRLYYEHIDGDLMQEKEDGILRLIIRWPKDENHDLESIQIIEMFSIVKIELKRASVLKLEAKLLRYP